MKKIKILSCAGILASLLIVGCNDDNKQGQNQNNNPPVEEKSDAPIVFVFSGQSNMEGNTNFGNGNGDTALVLKTEL